MAAVLLNTEECDIGHEALLLKAYSEDAMFAAGNLQSKQVRERFAVLDGNRTRDREQALMIMIAPAPALVEVGDKVSIIRSVAFPQCP
jgi:hypothetical protein